MTHMTAHFRGGPWADKNVYKTCDKPHDHAIVVEDVLPLHRIGGHYEKDGDVLSTEVFGELLVDVVYHWVAWVDSDGQPIRGR